MPEAMLLTRRDMLHGRRHKVQRCLSTAERLADFYHYASLRPFDHQTCVKHQGGQSDVVETTECHETKYLKGDPPDAKQPG